MQKAPQPVRRTIEEPYSRAVQGKTITLFVGALTKTKTTDV